MRINTHIIEKINRPISRLGDSYKIAFCGVGDVAESGLSSICDTPLNEFNRPGLGDIYLIGSNSSSHRRQRLAEQANQRIAIQPNSKTKVHNVNYDDITDLLPSLDLFFLTVNKTPPNEVRRSEMLRYNLDMINGLTKFFSKEFKGIINIVSNLPEGLAHYAATKWDLNDIRQITAHLPLDLIRYQDIILNELIENGVYENDDIHKLDLRLSGYHDLPWPIIDGSKVVLDTQTINKYGETICHTENIEDFIRDLATKVSLNDLLSNNGLMHSLLQKKEIEEYKQKHKYDDNMLLLSECPTAGITGRAIKEFTKAVINRDSTATAIPFKFHDYDKWFFVDLPVTFKRGYPQIDLNESLSKYDYNMIRQRIIGETQFDDRDHVIKIAKKILGPECNFSKQNIPKKNTLEKVISDVIGKDCNFIISNPDDLSILEEIFNNSREPINLRQDIHLITNKKTKPEIKRTLNKRIYYVKNDEPIIIYSRNLSSNDNPLISKYRLVVKNDGKYESRMSIRKIIEHGTKLIVESLYRHKKVDNSHWLFFNINQNSNNNNNNNNNNSSIEDNLKKTPNGFIKPEQKKSFKINGKHVTLLHLSNRLNNTVALHQDNIYFLIKEQNYDQRAIVFNPLDPDFYEAVGKGVDKDKPIISIASVEDDLIFSDTEKFYKLYKTKLREISNSLCIPRIVKSLYYGRTILYSDSQNNKTYAFNIDSTGKHVEVNGSNNFDVYEGNNIVLASIIDNKIQRSIYQSSEDLINNNPSDIENSISILGLSKVIISDGMNLLGISQNDTETRIHPLDVQTMKPYGEVITLHNSYFNTCNLSKK
jgi:malate/lactate dehydrogenase